MGAQECAWDADSELSRIVRAIATGTGSQCRRLQRGVYCSTRPIEYRNSTHLPIYINIERDVPVVYTCVYKKSKSYSTVYIGLRTCESQK